MSIQTAKLFGSYIETTEGFVHAFMPVDLSELDEVTIVTPGGIKGHYIKTTDGAFVMAVGLVDSAGDPLDLSDSHVAAVAVEAVKGTRLGYDHGTSYEPIDSRLMTSVSAVVANTLNLGKFRVPRPMTIAAIGVYIGASAGNMTVGIFTSDGTTWTPIRQSAATLETATSAEQVFPLTSSIALVPGVDYWHGEASTGAPTLLRTALTGSAAQGSGQKIIAKSSYLPTGGSFTAPTTPSSMYWVRLVEA